MFVHDGSAVTVLGHVAVVLDELLNALLLDAELVIEGTLLLLLLGKNEVLNVDGRGCPPWNMLLVVPLEMGESVETTEVEVVTVLEIAFDVVPESTLDVVLASTLDAVLASTLDAVLASTLDAVLASTLDSGIASTLDSGIASTLDAAVASTLGGEKLGSAFALENVDAETVTKTYRWPCHY